MALSSARSASPQLNPPPLSVILSAAASSEACRFNQEMSSFMPDLIRKFRRVVSIFLLFVAACIVASCAGEKPALVDDPNAKRETAMPWNKQEQWETDGGAMAGASDRR